MSTSPEPASYEQAMAELERLVHAMENEQLPLDQVLRSYQRGAELLVYCRGRLEAVEQQVKVLDDGQLRPWTSARDASLQGSAPQSQVAPTPAGGGHEA